MRRRVHDVREHRVERGVARGRTALAERRGRLAQVEERGAQRRIRRRERERECEQGRVLRREQRVDGVAQVVVEALQPGELGCGERVRQRFCGLVRISYWFCPWRRRRGRTSDQKALCTMSSTRSWSVGVASLPASRSAPEPIIAESKDLPGGRTDAGSVAS